MFIKWDDKYSVKNATIDAQHKKLFELANVAHNMVGKQADSAEVKKVLLALFDYMKTHFKDEEAYMESIKYPGLASHREKHRQIISEMVSFVKNVKFDFKEKLAVIMEHWILNHILQDDMDYGDFLQSASSKTPPVQAQKKEPSQQPVNAKEVAKSQVAQANELSKATSPKAVTTPAINKATSLPPVSKVPLSNANASASVNNTSTSSASQVEKKPSPASAKPASSSDTSKATSAPAPAFYKYKCLCGKIYKIKPDVHAKIQAGDGTKCLECTTFIKYVKDA